jgi:hypothetical protein
MLFTAYGRRMFASTPISKPNHSETHEAIGDGFTTGKLLAQSVSYMNTRKMTGCTTLHTTTFGLLSLCQNIFSVEKMTLTSQRVPILTCNQIPGKRREASSSARVEAEIWIVRGGGVAVNQVVSERLDCGQATSQKGMAHAAFCSKGFQKTRAGKCFKSVHRWRRTEA